MLYGPINAEVNNFIRYVLREEIVSWTLKELPLTSVLTIRCSSRSTVNYSTLIMQHMSPSVYSLLLK